MAKYAVSNNSENANDANESDANSKLTSRADCNS